MINKIKDIIIIVLSLVALLSFIFNHGCEVEKQHSSIDTVYLKSTDRYHNMPFLVEVPKPYRVEIPGTPGATITIPANVDSNQVVLDYFTKRSYNDSITNDSLSIYLQEEVFKNELKRVKVGYRWKAPTMQINKTTVVEKQLMFLGLEPYGNLNSFGMFASADFDAKRMLLGYGYDPFNKTHKISVKAKIRLWKKKS